MLQCKDAKTRKKKRSRCGVFWRSQRARPGHFAPLTSALAVSHAHVFLSSARRLLGNSQPQKHGENQGNEGQTEEEEGAHMGRGCSHGKSQTFCIYIVFIMAVFMFLCVTSTQTKLLLL